MIALLRSTDGQPDSRFEKYVNFLKDQQIKYLTICWDRLGLKGETNNQYYYRKRSSYGLRFGNIKSLIGFNWFLFKSLLTHRKEYQVIHAADFDTIIPAIWMKILFGKKIIYDIYDWYIDSRGLFKSKLRYLIKFIEYFNLKLSDMVIICEAEREKQIEFKAKNLKVLPNIPNFKDEGRLGERKSENITIAYVGILGGSRGLDKLIRLAERNPGISIEVGGFGPLEKNFKDACNHLPNLHFHGRLDYKEALDLMSGADLIYAVYERDNPNHILAAPNKYYEGLYLGKPIITTVGTLVGKKVEKYKTGFTVDEQYESLESLILSLNKETIIEVSANAAELWQGKYENYVENFFLNEYMPFILEP